MVLFAVAAALNACVKIWAVRRGRRWAVWIPSGIAFAVGFLNTPSFSLARLIGGIIEYVYNRRHKGEGGSTVRLVIIASGFVLGEGTFSIVSLVLKTMHVGVISCWGCAEGSCPGC